MGVKIEIEDVFEIFVYDPNFDFVLHQPNLVLTPTHIEQWEAKSWWKENVDEILGCSYGSLEELKAIIIHAASHCLPQ